MLELTASPLSKPRRTTSGYSGFVSLVGRNNCVALTSFSVTAFGVRFYHRYCDKSKLEDSSSSPLRFVSHEYSLRAAFLSSLCRYSVLYLVVKLMSQQAMTTHILLVVRVGFVVPKQGNVPSVGSAVGMIGSWLPIGYSNPKPTLLS